MLSKIIDFSLSQRLLLGLFSIVVIGVGLWSYRQLPVDAFPDISPVMVPIFAEAHGMVPEEVERLITFPIEAAMSGLPGVTDIRSTSAFGMSVIYIYFKDGTDIYFARQIVAERLNAAIADLPEMHEPPGLGPISTGLGQVFMYYLTADSTADTGGLPNDIYLRTLNDWVIKYQLKTVSGVTDVLSMGGNVLQFQVHIDPFQLIAYDLALDDVVEAIEMNNKNVGGQFIVRGREEYLVRGLGLIEDADQLAQIKVKEHHGTVVHLGDLARVEIGPEIRRGVVLKNGVGEVVAGLVIKLYGENTSKVIDDLYVKVSEIQTSLPQGVQLVPYYDQAELVAEATSTVKNALLGGVILVIIVLFLFLGDVRSALVVTLSLPMAMLVAVLMMKYSGISANLMSLGGLAIAIGMMVDGAVVMVENIWRHLSESKGQKPLTEVVRTAATEVARPIAFAIVIIIVVFLPLFTLQGVEGKMFSPMAFSITFGLVGSLIFTFTLIPMLATLIFRGKISEKESLLVRMIKKVYRPILNWALKRRLVVIGIAVVALLISLALVPFLGTEFVPTLEEGSIQVQVVGAPSTSLVEMTRIMQLSQKKLEKQSEITYVVIRIGRPEAGSHPHPVNTAEIMIGLKPYNEWQRGRSKQDLIDEIRQELESYPGIQLTVAQPIQNLFDELLSGVKAELAVKLYGEDLTTLRQKGEEIKSIMGEISGIADLSLEQSFGQPQVQVDVDVDRAARYGIGVDEVLEVVELGIGGEVIGQVFQGTRRFGILVRFDEQYRNDVEAIGNLRIHSPNGSLIPLADVAEIKEVIGPIQVNREKNQRRIVIQANVEGRDLGSIVDEIKDNISKKLDLPPGYFIEYGGQFENQQRAMARLAIIVPMTMFFIFVLLFSAFNSIRQAVLIYLNIPFALIGGILGLFVSGQYLSVPAAVGFIALFGVAVQNGVVMVSYFNDLRKQGMPIRKVVINGAMLRVRPVLMTALTTMLGLAPLLLSRGIGSEVQRPLAAVVIGGLITSTALTLLIIPALYGWFTSREEVLVIKE
ncbi:CusA/CzcA family heavy metal efflux RND transporter [candidate division LCP-89 bacterium B3_LCP]|uniref:CusA/CzcA family heavy metal efflux RND transporter n=1 Tax=candidate division LCP-89 bacterium B3_LCP TaxID=2012998 RepID=A0A532V0D0_UNCL8|nr:MAG: CusA/CzcA family heavy metal efflux RND transporter [candidate division LCP-89 bacterium B3_LCP]